MKQLNTTIDIKELIMQLLRQDLKIFRLRQGLNDLGFSSEYYYTDLPHIVYELMGIPKDRFEEADERYTKLLHTFNLQNLGDEAYLDMACATLWMGLGRSSVV